MRAAGARRDFSELPTDVRTELELMLGSRIVAAETQPSGYSPGVAARVQLANGERAFVKAVGPEPNADSPGFHRREQEIVASLPRDAPVPAFLGGVDDGAWVALAFEEIDGRHPELPWRTHELERVYAGAQELVDALTPSPVAVEQAGEDFARTINSWQRLREEPPSSLDEWSRQQLDELTALESRVGGVVGNTLLHLDIREDNVLFADSRVYFVDWPHAQVGPSWIDAICFAPSVTLQGGPGPEEVLNAWPGGATAPSNEVDVVLAAFAGFLTHRSLQPPAPGLPGLREFQAAQGEVARRWLAERTGW